MQTPPDPDLHVIVYNYRAHKHATVKAWPMRNPLVDLQFTGSIKSTLLRADRRKMVLYVRHSMQTQG